MSKNHHPKRSDDKEVKEVSENEPLNPPVILQDRKPTPFKTVGTVRKSKSGNAISIKLISENRFLHISKRDIELILLDENNVTVANIREYEKLENLTNGVV
jgi:hypothetical protein